MGNTHNNEIIDKKTTKSGIEVLGDVCWGGHFCLFYQTKQDLLDILVPYFKAGLDNNEFCMWITSEPLEAEKAKNALDKAVKNLDFCISKGQIEITDYKQWYLKSGVFDADIVLNNWIEKEAQAVKNGFEGLRLSGNTFWLQKKEWAAFTDYEAKIDNVINKYRMLAICTYSLDKCGAAEVIDVVSNHESALVKRGSEWQIIESAKSKKVKDDLKKSEKRFETSLESLMDGFSIFSSIRDNRGKIIDFRYEYINEAGCKLNQRTYAEQVDHTLLELLPKHKKTELFDKYVQVVETGKPFAEESYVYEDIFGGGKKLNRAFSFQAVKLEDGFSATWRDITESKKAEEKIKNQNVLLEEAVKEKEQEMKSLMERLIRQEKLAAVGQISSSIAHELRNPLSIIKQSIFFLNCLVEKNELESSGAKVKKHFELLSSKIDESNKVISNLLQMTKMGPLEKNHTNLRIIISEVLDKFSVGKNIKLKTDLKPEPFLIWSDPKQIGQVLLNLLSNASNAIFKNGVITIGARISKKNQKCSIKIQDDGSGIAPENLEKVFEPLYTSKAKGIGLGLSICKQIVENHGGTITLTSEIGKGTTVSIDLPYEN